MKNKEVGKEVAQRIMKVAGGQLFTESETGDFHFFMSEDCLGKFIGRVLDAVKYELDEVKWDPSRGQRRAVARDASPPKKLNETIRNIKSAARNTKP